jgi:hypothetical protein
VVPSQLIELGQQALAAMVTSVDNGEPLLRCQLLASEFYEALRRELRQSSQDEYATRRKLIIATNQCYRIATASISPDAMLGELRGAIAVLESDIPLSEAATVRPVLRVIEGGLSRR